MRGLDIAADSNFVAHWGPYISDSSGDLSALVLEKVEIVADLPAVLLLLCGAPSNRTLLARSKCVAMLAGQIYKACSST